MSAWQIPLSGTPAPRENPFEAVQRAQLTDQTLAASKEENLVREQQIAASKQEQLLREQQIREAKMKNDLAEQMPDLMHGYFAISHGYGDGFGKPGAPSTTSAATSDASTLPPAIPAAAPPANPLTAAAPIATTAPALAPASRLIDASTRSLPAPPAESSLLPPSTTGTTAEEGTPQQTAPAPDYSVTRSTQGTPQQTAPAPASSTLGSARSLSPAPAANAPAPAPASPLNFQFAPSAQRHADAMKWLMSQKGGYALAQGLEKDWNDSVSKEMTRVKEATEVAGKQLAGLSGIAATIETMPVEQRPTYYKANLNTLRSLAHGFGYDPGVFPDEYNAGAMQVISRAAMDAEKQLTEARAGTTAAEALVSGRIKNGNDFVKEYRNAVATTRNPDELNAINRSFEALAKVRDDQGLMQLGVAFAAAKENNWTSDLPKRMNELLMTGEQRATAPATILRAQTDATRAHTAELRAEQAQNGGAESRADTNYELANRAWDESNKNGGNNDGSSGIAAARRNVMNPKNYVNDPIGKNRGGVLRALDQMETQGIRRDNLPDKNIPTDTDLIEWKVKHKEWRDKHKPADRPTVQEVMASPDWIQTHPGLARRSSGGTATPQSTGASSSPAGPRYTEAQIRQDAQARRLAPNGPEADRAVERARANGTLQQ